MYGDPVHSAWRIVSTPQISTVLSLAKDPAILVSRFWWTYWGSVSQWLIARTLQPGFLGWDPDSTTYLCDLGQAPYTFVWLRFPICKVGITIGIW